MIKQTLAALVLAAATATAIAQEAPKMIAVNMETLFQGFYEVKEAESKFQTSIEAVNTELQDMAAEVQPEREEFQALVAKSRNEALTDEARQEAQQQAIALEAKLREKQQEFGQFQQQQRQTLDLRRNEIVKQHVDKIREVVTQFAQSKGATLVVNTAQQGVVYVADSFDMTDEVLAILNADAPAAE